MNIKSVLLLLLLLLLLSALRLRVGGKRIKSKIKSKSRMIAVGGRGGASGGRSEMDLATVY